MVEERVQRRLAAVLAVDAVGFSRMMEVDESGTLERLKSLRREIFSPMVTGHGGRIVKLMGDGALVEFPSAVDAVHCAVAFQEKVFARNADAGPSEAIQFRVGVSIGDVIAQGRDIYGSGVNVAARLESIADPGTVLISHNVYEQARRTTKLLFVDLGERHLKNIATPVRVYQVESSGDNNKRQKDSATLLNRPAIAVLPFVNMSGDPEQEYFADGLTEDIITALSHWRLFPVVARTSVFTYKGKQIKVQQVAEELGVSYILEGSVRKVGNRIRITIQLIDAETSHHIWAQNFNRDIVDIFSLQDEITNRIAGTMQPELARAEGQRSLAKAPKDLTAWDYFQRGSYEYWKYTLGANKKAREFLEHAIEMDSNYSKAYSGLTLCYHNEILLRVPGALRLAPQRMLETARRAVELDDQDASARVALAFAYHRTSQHDLAVLEARKAIDLNPGDPLAHGQLGSILDYMGRSEAAIACFETTSAMFPTLGWEVALQCRIALCYLHARDYDAAVERAHKAISADPKHPHAYVTLAASLAHLDRLSDAREALAKGEATEPDFVEKWHEWPLYHLDEQKQLVIDGLRQAGWKGDPSQLPSPWQPGQDS